MKENAFIQGGKRSEAKTCPIFESIHEFQYVIKTEAFVIISSNETYLNFAIVLFYIIFNVFLSHLNDLAF